MKPLVLVVGAGPVGLTMAAELARYGVAVRIVDLAPARTDKSKALVLWSRSLELIDRMGCGAAFVDAGLKVTAANIIAGEHPIAHIHLDTLDTPHPYALMLPQSETERLMEAHLNACGVRVERQVELTDFVARTDQVVATLRSADGRAEDVSVEWLVGCDGAHSAVRHGLGMEFEGDTLPSEWILADVHLDGLGAAAAEVNIYWHARGVLAIFPISAGRFRVIADVGDRDERDAQRTTDPTLADVQAILDQRGLSGLRASAPIWIAFFRINERKVADYRSGRVFLAGDAAHIHSPAGGQGMNTGMQDAVNLAWKLALVCRGMAPSEPLLGSYSIERSAVGEQVLRDAGRLTTLAILRGGVSQSIRNHVASLLFGLGSVRATMASKLAELSVGYPASPLTRSLRIAHRADPTPGARAPLRTGEAPFGAGQTPRFAVCASPNSNIASLIARHRALVEPDPRPPFADGGLWLVRPDGYVAVAAHQDDWAEADGFMAEIIGGLGRLGTTLG